jgi:hypothetical protein
MNRSEPGNKKSKRKKKNRSKRRQRRRPAQCAIVFSYASLHKVSRSSSLPALHFICFGTVQCMR